MNGNSLVSIVIVNYNGRDLLLACLESVFVQHYRPIEVIVVDNGSHDGSLDAVRTRYPETVIIDNPDNRGFAGANNQGVASSHADDVILLNNDTTVDSGWIPALLEQREATAASIVASRVETQGVPEEFYGRNGSLNYLGYNIMRVFEDQSQIFYAGGASLFLRKSDFPIPFPEFYFLYQEDVFLSWRARLGGKTIAMAQKSIVHHAGSATSKTQPSAFISFYQERNRLLNALLFYERWTLVRLMPYFVADAIAKCALALAGRGKSLLGIARGYGWIIGHAAWIARMRQTIQRERVVCDKEILSLMSPHLSEGISLPGRFINALSRSYARMTGLPFHA